jgi:hypothetical protein
MKRACERLLTLFVCGILCCSLSSAQTKPIDVAVRDLSQTPRKFDGLLVRVRARAVVGWEATTFCLTRRSRLAETKPLAAPELCGFIAMPKMGGWSMPPSIAGTVSRRRHSPDIFISCPIPKIGNSTCLIRAGCNWKLLVSPMWQSRKLPGSVWADESSDLTEHLVSSEAESDP